MKKTKFMGDSWKQSFYPFLVDNYIIDEGPIGDLTRAVMADKWFPKKSHSRDFIRNYLEEADYSEDDLEAFDEAFDLYLSELYQMAREDGEID